MTTIPTRAEVREDVNVLFRNAPPSPVGGKQIEIAVVGKRCVYLNNYRVAGGKPYVSENLPSHTLTTSLEEIVDALSEADLRAALNERKAYRDYLKAYHAQPDDARALERSVG